MPENQYSMSRGTLVSVLSSTVFAGIYFATPWLAPLGGLHVWAIRVILSIPVLALILHLMKQTRLFTDIWVRIKAKPLLLVGVFISGLLLSLQLWIFSWAPLNGRAMQVALGYFLLPLVLVVIGRFLYKDKLNWHHWIAALLAAAGVTAQIINVGGVSWETLIVCLGYPVYFVLRRSLKTASTGGMLWDFIAVSPLAVVVVAFELTGGSSFSENPILWIFAPAFGILAAVALWLYIYASRLLPLSIFGLLSYLEPALLVVAALLLGEHIPATEYPTYALIWAAVIVLLVGGIGDLVRSARPKK